MSTHEAILQALVERLATAPAGSLPPAELDEPEPTVWIAKGDPAANGRQILHALAVQDGPPADRLSFVRGAAGDPLEELELEAAIAYGVQVKPGADDTVAQVRTARRAARDAAVGVIKSVIEADRTLGLGVEVYADIDATARQDGVAFPNALPAATAVMTVKILYPAASAAD